jgi:hypothetical protein
MMHSNLKLAYCGKCQNWHQPSTTCVDKFGHPVVVLPKPRLRAYSKVWECSGDGVVRVGWNPLQAYMRWKDTWLEDHREARLYRSSLR